MAGLSRILKSVAVNSTLVGAAFLSAVNVNAAAPDKAGAKVAVPEAAVETLKRQFPDLTSHPLAGETVSIQIRNKDGLGQEGKSNAVAYKLPVRTFRNPLSTELAHVRRDLFKAYYTRTPAQAAEEARIIAGRMGQLLQAQEANAGGPVTLAALQDIQKRIAATPDAKTVDQAVNELWPLMIQLEEMFMTAAEKKLREAIEELRKALEQKNAKNMDKAQEQKSAEDLDKAMKDANKAMDETLKEMQQKAEQAKDKDAEKELENLRKMLEEMRKMMEQMSKEQKPDVAEKMMQQAQKMEQMQQQDSSQQQKSRQDLQKQMQKMMQKMQQQQQNAQMKKDMQELIEKQKKLNEETSKSAEERQMDLDKIQKQLDQFSKMLKDKIEQKGDENSARQQELATKAYEAGQALIKKQIEEKTSTADIKAQADALEADKKDHMAPLDEREKQFRQLKQDNEAVQKQLKSKQEKQQSMTEAEAKAAAAKLGEIQQKLRQMDQEQKQQQQSQQGQDGQQQQDQQQDGQQQQEDLAKQIEQMMKELQQKGQQQQQGRQGSQLQKQQQDLQQQLAQMMQKMQQRGMKPGKLQDADGDMGQSSEQLGQDNLNDAMPDENQALQNLREGQQQMQQQMQQQQQGQQPGQGKGGSGGEGEGDAGKPDDLKGRFDPSDGASIDPAGQKNLSRQIREEILRRRANPNASPEELKYLERLVPLEQKPAAPSP